MLKANPTREGFENALFDFRAAGLRDADLWARFLNQVHNNIVDANGKPLRLPKEHRQMWVDYLNKLEPFYHTILDGKRVVVTDDDQPKSLARRLKQQKGVCPLTKLARLRQPGII